ncbi:hypothetical protein D3C72_1458260 [compost metagenome]
MRGLPGTQDHLAHTTHGLAVGAEHADGANVVQDVFRRNGLLADAAFGKGQIFGNACIQVVADHEHVHMLIQRIDRIGARGVGGTGQHIRLAHHLEDVGRMATARALGVESVDGTALEGCHRIFHEAAFVEGIGMNGDLRVGVFGHSEAVVDSSWCAAPILVQLEANGACRDLLV